MKTAAFALVLAASAAMAQDAAPQDGAAPTDVVPAVDCHLNTDCRVFDAAGTCTGGACECTGTDTSRFCTGTQQDVAQLRASFNFANVVCPVSAAVSTQIRGEVQKNVKYTYSDYQEVCGSLLIVMTFSTQANQADTLLQEVTTNMQAVQQAVPVLANATLTMDTSFGNNTQQCTVRNAASAILLESRTCFPTCNPGFVRMLVNGTYSCNGPTLPPTRAVSNDDDSMPAEQIVAIVVGSVLFVGIIAFVLIHFLGGGNGDVPTGEQNENEPYDKDAQGEATV